MAEISTGVVDGELRRGEGERIDVVILCWVAWVVFILVIFSLVVGSVWEGVYPHALGDGGVADVWAGGVVAVMTYVVSIISEAVPWRVAGAGVDVVVDANSEVSGGHSKEGGEDVDGMKLHLMEGGERAEVDDDDDNILATGDKTCVGRCGPTVS